MPKKKSARVKATAQTKTRKTKVKKASGSKTASKGARLNARIHWFDEESHRPLIDGYARKMQSFLDTLANGVVNDAEVMAQEERLVQLMQEVEPKLTDAMHEKITRLLCELSAYDIMQMLHSMHTARPKTVFQG